MPHTFGFDSVSGGGGGGGGITDLNGLVVATQSFAVGTAGVDFNIISASPTHTFNLPDASAITRGALTSADWTTFNGKLSTAILSINGMTGTAQTINSGSTGTDFNISSVGDITTLNLPTASAVNRGALSSADWSTFNGKLSTAILSINGMTGTAQTINSGSTGTDLNIASVGNTTTINLPTASAVNRGALSSADWSTFNGKLSTAILSINGMTGTAQTINSGSTGTDLNIASAGNVTTINIPDASTTARGLVTTGTQTFGGAKTFTQTTSSAFIVNGTYTALASGVSHALINPAITLATVFQGNAIAVNISPTMVATTTQQSFIGLNIAGTYTSFGTGNNVSRLIPINADGINIAGGRTSTILLGTAGAGVIPSGFGAIHIGFDVGGGNSILIGRQAGLNGGSASSILIGGRAGFQAGNSLIGIGGDVAFNVSTPTNSIIIGGTACQLNASGGNATFFTNGVMLGSGARSFNNTDNNSIVIGTNAIGQGSNSVLLGDNNITRTFLKGDTAIGYAPTTATITPNARLDVIGSSAVTGSAFVVFNSTPTQLMKIDNNGNIGFYTATPVARATTGGASSTYSAVGGTNVQTNDTFDGYTIAQVVKALRNIGILT